jgi:hypothetical protein
MGEALRQTRINVQTIKATEIGRVGAGCCEQQRGVVMSLTERACEW